MYYSKFCNIRTITHNSLVYQGFIKEPCLNPNWITGFSDAEGCFTVIISKRSDLRWRIIVSFEINLHSKDILILNQIKDYFGVGSVTNRPTRNLCVYRVTKPDDLIKVIIPRSGCD